MTTLPKDDLAAPVEVVTQARPWMRPGVRHLIIAVVIAAAARIAKPRRVPRKNK